jgi:exopolysaccharide biosynthesis polyprenyl glycosylphosphotransferase
MEKTTTLIRTMSSAKGFLDTYIQLHKTLLQRKQQREIARLSGHPNRLYILGGYPEAFGENAITYNNLFSIEKNEGLFYPNNYWFRAIKRAFDLVFSLVVIIFILSWLLPFIIILVKLESKGPAFFVQLRSGRDNTSFKCYKFRSMFINKDCNTSQTAEGDPRITKIGAFLRRSSLDELPQFFNVLLGQMSVVGPRPHMLSQTRHYSELIDKFMVRHFIKPGITGWAQINGLRGQTKTLNEMLNRVEADVWYIKNWSFMLDLKIVFITVFKVVTGDKNAF